MTKQGFKFTWATTAYQGNADTTRREFGSWRLAGEHAARQERSDKAWRCVQIEREDSDGSNG